MKVFVVLTALILTTLAFGQKLINVRRLVQGKTTQLTFERIQDKEEFRYWVGRGYISASILTPVGGVLRAGLTRFGQAFTEGMMVNGVILELKGNKVTACLPPGDITSVAPTRETIMAIRRLIQGEQVDARFFSTETRLQFWQAVKSGHRYPVLVTVSPGAPAFAVALLKRPQVEPLVYNEGLASSLLGLVIYSSKNRSEFRIDSFGGSG